MKEKASLFRAGNGPLTMLGIESIRIDFKHKEYVWLIVMKFLLITLSKIYKFNKFPK